MWLSVQDQTLSEIWGVAMAIPIVGKKFPFVLHSDIILQNDDYEETCKPKGGKIFFWRCKSYLLSHLLFVKHWACAQIVISCIFCRFRYIFISQTAIIILKVISPKCNNQRNTELRDIYPISYAKYQFLVYCTADVDLLLLTVLPMLVEISKIQNLPMLFIYINHIIYV